MLPITRLGLIVNFTRPHALEGCKVLLQAAQAAGITLLSPPDKDGEPLPGTTLCAIEAFADAGAQGVISLGGDGSLLAAAHALSTVELPMIGLNIGHLGYLTAVNEEGFGHTLQALAAGRYTLEERATLAAEVFRGETLLATFPDALNDVVIARKEGGHAFGLHVELDGFPVAHYVCDGLILSTPTGSTAYSLSVGGPVVAPAARTTVLSVIAPHTLSARPLVIPDTTRITVRLDDDTEAIAYVDGQRMLSLQTGDTIAAQVAERPIRLMVLDHHNPYEALSRKLGWSAVFKR